MKEEEDNKRKTKSETATDDSNKWYFMNIWKNFKYFFKKTCPNCLFKKYFKCFFINF